VCKLNQNEGEEDELSAIFELWRKDVVDFVKDLNYGIEMVGVSAVEGLGIAGLLILMVISLAYPFYTLNRLQLLVVLLALCIGLFWIYRSARLLGRYRFLKRKYKPLLERTSAIETRGTE